MVVRCLAPEENEWYDQYLTRQQCSLFYHSSKYKAFLRELLGCEEQYLLAVESNSIKGVLPLLFMESGGRRIYNSLPYYGSNGGIISDSEGARQKLTEAYNDIALSSSTVSMTIITNPLCNQDLRGFVHNFEDCRIGQFTPLTTTDADATSSIEASARRNVKKAMASGVSIGRDGSQISRLREMHQANITAMGGIPKTNAFFDLVPKFFSEGVDYDLFVARRDGITIAALMVFYFNKTVEYFVPAIDAEHRSMQPLALILMTAVAEARQRGFLRWNWGGTWPTQTTLYRFKRKWGAVDRPYTYYTQLNDPSILMKSKTELLTEFSNFYVVPFSALCSGDKHGE